MESQIFFTPADGITNSYLFSLIADKTLDISNKVQVSIRIRYSSNSFISGKVFLGFSKLVKQIQPLHLVWSNMGFWGLAWMFLVCVVKAMWW